MTCELDELDELHGGAFTPELLDTEDRAFAGDPCPPAIDLRRGGIDVRRPGAVVLAGAA